MIQLSGRSQITGFPVSSNPKVVAAIPCFNTQSTIADVVKRTKAYVDEVIVIDDGSCDMTAFQAHMAGASVWSYDRNKGYGEAIRSCFSAAQEIEADILVIIDGDGQHDPDEIPGLLKPLRNHKADLVIGSRFLSNGYNIPPYRKMGINMINALWNVGSRWKVTDTQSGFRAYGKMVIEAMSFTEKGMSASIEILEKARKMQSTVVEVPITCSYENNNSTLSFKAIKHGVTVFLAVLRIRLKNILLSPALAWRTRNQ